MKARAGSPPLLQGKEINLKQKNRKQNSPLCPFSPPTRDRSPIQQPVIMQPPKRTKQNRDRCSQTRFSFCELCHIILGSLLRIIDKTEAQSPSPPLPIVSPFLRFSWTNGLQFRRTERRVQIAYRCPHTYMQVSLHHLPEAWIRLAR